MTIDRITPFHSKGSKINQPSIYFRRLQNLINGKPPEICIIRGEGIGDVIMTLPTVKALHESFKEVNITYATNLNYLDGALPAVLKYNPCVNKVVNYSLINETDYDLIVNLHCPALKYEVKGRKPPNRIDIFAHHAGITLEDTRPYIYLTEYEKEVAQAFKRQASLNDKCVLVQPFASNHLRSFNHRVLKEAISLLYMQYDIRSFVVTHDSDFQSDTMWSNIPGCIPINNWKVREIAALMLECDLVLCPDSSILHLAGALDIPTVSIFTKTYPPSRINYYPNTVALWDGESIPGCPCWYESYCHLGNACSINITADRIIQQCLAKID